MIVVVTPGTNWPDCVCLGLRAFLAWIVGAPARGKIALVEVQTGGPAALARYEANLDEVANLLRMGRKTARDGNLPDSLEQTTVLGSTGI